MEDSLNLLIVIEIKNVVMGITDLDLLLIEDRLGANEELTVLGVGTPDY